MDGVTRTISYADAVNPSNWFNGTDFTNLTWTQGRRLGSVTKGSDLYSYAYDMSGVRSVKVANGLRHEYVTQNGRVVREKVTNDATGAFQYMLDFVYDESGHPFLMRRYYNEAQTNYNTYHYVLNAQGDVIKLMHGASTTVAEYSYDAWGNILDSSGNLADVNPLRYRGYYYDTETGFYYLQSRYYDPIVKRFLNADSYASTGQGFLGYNMFAYCGNCPAYFCDKHGNYPVFIDVETEEPTVRIPGTADEYCGMTNREWHEANRRPNTGDPNSEFDAPNGDKRFFGEDRKPYLDYDHDDHNDPDNHPHDENGGHWHRWVNGKREKKGRSSPLLGALEVVGGAILISAIYVDDLTGIGTADNAYADQIIIWIEDGWALLFG